MSLSANSPNGTKWVIYAQDETPILAIEPNPPNSKIIDTVYESPTFYSPNRLLSKQLVVSDAGVWTLRDAPLNQATFEYVEMVTPAGVSWVFYLADDGLFYTELFTSGVPKQRRLVTVLMHQGSMMWIADNRFPKPRRS